MKTSWSVVFHMCKGLADTCVDRGPKRMLRGGMIALEERRIEEGYILCLRRRGNTGNIVEEDCWEMYVYAGKRYEKMDLHLPAFIFFILTQLVLLLNLKKSQNLTPGTALSDFIVSLRNYLISFSASTF